MEIFLNVLLLILGFVFLSKGADWFVDGASGIATKFKIPQLVIGLTIVAMGTSAPEAAVSISSALKGNADITIGNIVGSNILNVLIILGLSATITSLAVSKDTIWVDIPVVTVATIALLLMGLDGKIVWWEGLIMLVFFVSYMSYLFYKAFKNKKKIEQGNNEEIVEEEAPKKEIVIWKALLFTVIGLAMVVFGSNFVVDSSTFLAKQMGISDRFIGLTVIALGTSLPELFTSVSAAMKKNADIAIGNIIGSNIFNILFVVGLSSVITEVPFVKTFIIDTLIAFASVILLFLCCLKDKKLHRWAGILMLVSYSAYFVYLLNLG